MRYIGVDLHKVMFAFCVREGDRETITTYRTDELDSFKKTLQKTDQVAVEACGTD
jgi:hypothetical protein